MERHILINMMLDPDGTDVDADRLHRIKLGGKAARVKVRKQCP